MGKHLLFLVHGMGVHRDAAWSEGPVARLKELSRSYPWFEEHPLEELVEFKPIDYDSILCRVLDRWEKLPIDVAAFAAQAGLPHAGALDWLEGISAEESSFFWTHVADVLIYRAWGLERTAIQAHVVAELSQGIQRHRANDPQAPCSLLAHSLGTAVAHDALHALGTQTFGAHANALAPEHFRFQAIVTLANVSRILQDVDPYRSIVRPGPGGNRHSYCSEFHNARHEFDPFTLLKPFRPTAWGFAFTNTLLRHVRAPNVHGLEHFLDHPAVHIPLLNALAGAQVISTQERKLRSQEYRARDPLEAGLLDPDCAGIAQSLRSSFERIGELAEEFDEQEATLWEWVEVVLKAQRHAREASAAVEELIECLASRDG